MHVDPVGLTRRLSCMKMLLPAAQSLTSGTSVKTKDMASVSDMQAVKSHRTCE